MSFYRDWPKSSRLKIIDTYGDGHWDAFERARRKHNDNVCEETNKLVLRLDKLLNLEEDGKKHDLDQSIVEWTLDDLVKLCPYCAKSFTLTRRRHHCRVCGAILCNNCSKFLEHRAACRLVKPAKLYTDPYDRISERLETRSADERPKIRTCEDCKRLLDKRVQVIEAHYGQPTFLEVYQELRKSMADADELMLSQSSMGSAGGVSGGVGQKETTLELKSKIQDFRQAIAGRASRIKRMGEREPSDKQAYLLGAINQSVTSWLKESLEAKGARVQGLRLRGQPGGRPSGWVPEQPAGSALRVPDANESPYLIQIKQLEEFIKQAKLADRYEEVSALEASKRDLEIEYFIQQDLGASPSLTPELGADAGPGSGLGLGLGLGGAARPKVGGAGSEEETTPSPSLAREGAEGAT